MSEQITRRDAIKRVAYVAPLILTIAVAPSIATSGSGGTVSGGFEEWGKENYKSHPAYDKDKHYDKDKGYGHYKDKDKDKDKNKNG